MRDEGKNDPEAAFAFLLSIAATGYHPDALYQAGKLLERSGQPDLAREALGILLTHTPLHEAGRRLQARLSEEALDA